MDDEKRKAILSAATELFCHFGFKKTSMDDVAKKAEVAKGTLYLASSSKADLFYEVLLQQLREWNGELAKLIDPRRPAEEMLLEQAVQAILTLDQRPLVRDLLLGQYDDQLPKLRDRLDDLRPVAQANLLEILRIGMRQGAFRDNLDVEALADLMFDIQTMTYLFHLRGRDPARLGTRADTVFDVLMNGIRTKEDPSDTD